MTGVASKSPLRAWPGRKYGNLNPLFNKAR